MLDVARRPRRRRRPTRPPAAPAVRRRDRQRPRHAADRLLASSRDQRQPGPRGRRRRRAGRAAADRARPRGRGGRAAARRRGAGPRLPDHLVRPARRAGRPSQARSRLPATSDFERTPCRWPRSAGRRGVALLRRAGATARLHPPRSREFHQTLRPAADADAGEPPLEVGSLDTAGAAAAGSPKGCSRTRDRPAAHRTRHRRPADRATTSAGCPTRSSPTSPAARRSACRCTGPPTACRWACSSSPRSGPRAAAAARRAARGGAAVGGPAARALAAASPERENPRLSGGFLDAAEWSRTITGVSTHKALNLARLPVPPQPLEGGRF